MTRDEILTMIANDKELKSLAKSFVSGKKSWRDLFQMAMLALCELREEALVSMNENGRLRNYTFAIMRNNARNPRSKFSRQQISDSSVDISTIADEIPNETIEIKTREISKADILSYCDSLISKNDRQKRLAAQVTKLYLNMPDQKRSYRELQNETGIHYTSISVYVGQIKKELQQKYGNQVNH